MNPFVRSCFAVSFLLIPSSPGFAGDRSPHKAGPDLRITVWVYNYAHVPIRTLARAEKMTSEIFRKIGVETGWLDCPLPSTEATKTLACNEPFSATHLVLRILPRSMTAHFRSDRPRVDFTLGFAQSPSRDGKFSVIANIFYHRVLELTQRARHRAAMPVIILGHAMAHEMGHLLLDEPDHAAQGGPRRTLGQPGADRDGSGDLALLEARRLALGGRDAAGREEAAEGQDRDRRRETGCPGHRPGWWYGVRYDSTPFPRFSLDRRSRWPGLWGFRAWPIVRPWTSTR